MKNLTLLTLAAALLAGSAAAAAAPASVQDRITELCSVSNTDLEGQRLAKACRAEVRARFSAEQRAAAASRLQPAAAVMRTADATPVRPR